MKRAILAMALALSVIGTLAAARTFEMLEDAYELVLADIALPSSTAGTAVFRPCEECATVSLRVGAATRYLLDRREMPLADFRAAVEALRQTDGGDTDSAVSVYYNLETNLITRIAVSASR